jgi:hypothetical protein
MTRVNNNLSILFLTSVTVLCSQSEDEREMFSRTIYCTNIDKKVVRVLTLSLNLASRNYLVFSYIWFVAIEARNS